MAKFLASNSAHTDRSARARRKGRGAVSNRDGRFEPYRHEAIDDDDASSQKGLDNSLYGEDGESLDAPPPLRTTVRADRARRIIARNRSPDVPFNQSINPYRGCEHGCIYCYARPTHTYLGLSAGLDFETKLFAKHDAARLLEGELRRPGYRVSPIALGTNTDPYQPIERKLKITRQILEVLAAHNHPVSIVTKSATVERDIDILAPMANKKLAAVFVSITTLDHRLARRLEPRAAAPQRRVETLRRIAAAGIPVGVMVAPVIPVLTDAELESIIETAAKAGACWAGKVLLRLPHEVKDLFKEWLTAHAPLKAKHVMALVRASRGGRENDPQFGSRMLGTGEYADLLRRRFQVACRRFQLNIEPLALDTGQFRIPVRSEAQLKLFSES